MGNNLNNDTIKKIVLNNREYSEQLDIAECFNKYFNEVASSLENSLPNNDMNPLQFINRNQNSIYLAPVTLIECSNIINKLKLSKQHTNKIPIQLFIENHLLFNNVICNLINLSITSGKYPNSLKIAHITPIFKSGDPCSPQNFRPISILPFLGKIFERCIYNRLYDFSIKYSLFTSKQFGFLRNKSTSTAILNLTEYLYDVLDSRDISCNIFIDLKKAFDTIHHRILINNLNYMIYVDFH